MLLEVLRMIAHPLPATAQPVVAQASLGVPDTLFIFVVALVVFGPKRLPEIGRQIGKLVYEFRRASNDFKLQIEEELRLAEQQEKQKQLQAQTAAPVPAIPAPVETAETGLIVQPPSSGTQVEGRAPNRPASASGLMTPLPRESANGSANGLGPDGDHSAAEDASLTDARHE